MHDFRQFIIGNNPKIPSLIYLPSNDLQLLLDKIFEYTSVLISNDKNQIDEFEQPEFEMFEILIEIWNKFKQLTNENIIELR